MSTIDRAYASINTFLWGVLSTYGYLKEKSLIVAPIRVNWLDESDSIANILMDEYGETEADIPHMMEFCDRFTAETTEDFKKTAHRQSEYLESPNNNLLIYYQYIIMVIATFVTYTKIMEHDKLKLSPFYQRYHDNNKSFDKFMILLRQEKATAEDLILKSQQERSKNLIDSLQITTEQLALVWKTELLSYIGSIDN